MKKKLAILITLAIIFSLLTACVSGGGSVTGGQTTEEPDVKQEEKVTLRIYAQYFDDDTKVPYDYAVEALKTAYPNVTLELEPQAQDDAQKLMTLAATGNLPDIYQAALAQIENFKKSGNIMVLNEVAERTGFVNKVYESARNILYNEDGNIYAFPYAGNEYVLWYYNKALFDEYKVNIPTTFDELKTAIEVFRANDILPMALFGAEGWITVAFFDCLATRWDSGGVAKLDNGEALASDEAYVNAAEMMNELVRAGIFSDSVNVTNYDQASELFLSGKAAMFLNGQWYIPDATNALGDDVDWMYYPSYDKQSYEAGKKVWSGGGAAAGYAVNPDSNHKELAAEVAAFISEKYCEAKVKLRGMPFVTLDVDVEPEVDYALMTSKLIDYIPNITSVTKFDWHLTNPVFKTTIEDQTKFLLVPDYNVDDFIREVDNSLK